jgi:hypothetical protein
MDSLITAGPGLATVHNVGVGHWQMGADATRWTGFSIPNADVHCGNTKSGVTIDLQHVQ